MEKITYFKEDKICEYENFKYYIKNYDNKINFNEFDLSSVNNMNFSSLLDQNFCDMFKDSNLLVPIKNQVEYSTFREILKKFIIELYKIKVKLKIN